MCAYLLRHTCIFAGSGSLLYSAYLSHHAIPSTPADRAVTNGCYYTARSSLRRLRRGSTSALSTHLDSGGCVTRLAQVRLRYSLMGCSPVTSTGFYFRAFSSHVAMSEVGYDYTLNTQFA